VKKETQMATVATSYEKGKLYDLTLEEIQPDPEQPRKFFDIQALEELKASILKHGVLEPVLVRQNGGIPLLLVSGERRYQAAKLAGCATIPALLTDGDPVEISIVENLLRENLTAVEEAEAIDRLKNQHDYQLSDLSAMLGKSDTNISEILSLMKLPDEVKNDCRNDPKAIRGILVEIAKQRTTEKMVALYAKYKESGLTRGEIRKATAKQKPADAPINLAFINSCTERISALDLTKLDDSQMVALRDSLEKLRSYALKTLHAIVG
jgi:ParB family transcriptional regulator, chromosome partitioning protein